MGMHSFLSLRGSVATSLPTQVVMVHFVSAGLCSWCSVVWSCTSIEAAMKAFKNVIFIWLCQVGLCSVMWNLLFAA